MSELKVVMLTPHGDPLGRIGEPEVGGQCVYIRELSSHLALLGLKVQVFTRDRGDGKPSVEPIAPGAELVRLPCGPRTFIPKEALLPYLGEFAERVRTHLQGDEVLHSHFWDGGYVAEVLDWRGPWIHTSHSLGKRKLAAMPDADLSQYQDRIRIEKEVSEKCDLITAATNLEKDDLAKLYDVVPCKVVVIPPGVDTSRFRPPEDKDALRRELGFPDRPLVFTLGRLDERKGFDLFFRAAAHLLGQLRMDPAPLFVISAGVGGSPHEAEQRLKLEGLISSLGIEDHVRWLEVLPQEKLPLYYGAADVFVLPSRYELFGIVMLEAMACGVPVVATRFGGPAEVIAHGENGFLVDPTDTAEMAGAIEALVCDPELRREMGHRARRVVEERYSWEVSAQLHKNLYKGLASEKGKGER